MKLYRKLILSYSQDQFKKKKLFIQNYKDYDKELKKRNVKLSIKKNNNRSQLFNVSLYGYDTKLKYVTNKTNPFQIIIKKIDSMHMGRIEKLKYKLKSIELYTNAHPKSTVKNTGYKNVAIAKKSLLLIKKKPKLYQYLVVNSLYQRAKYHKHQTKEMRGAMKIFASWMKKYKKEQIHQKSKVARGGGVTNKPLPYLPLSLVNEYEKLAEYYNVSRKARGLEKPTTSDEGFLVVYRKVKGNGAMLKNIPCRKDKPQGVNWDRKRSVEVYGKLGQAQRMKLDLFHKSGPLEGLPTIIHINMIMWAYSPYKKELKNKLSLLKKT